MPPRKLKGSWYADFRCDGERHRKKSPVDTRQGASMFELELRRRLLQHGAITSPVAAKTTFAAFAAIWLREYVDAKNKPSERQSKRSILNAHLLPAFGKQRLAAITPHAIDRYQAMKRTAGLNPKTINNHITVLHKCLVSAVRWKYLETAPSVEFLRVDDPDLHALTTSEWKRLVTAADPGLWRAMVLTAIKTGLRHGELIALRWEDVIYESSPPLLLVRRSLVRGHFGSPKNYHHRKVEIASDVVEALEQIRRPSGFVFHRDGEPLGAMSTHRNLHKFYIRAGLEPTGWHTLRHTFATELLTRSKDLYSVMKLMGHSDVRVTLRYVDLLRATLQSTMAFLEPALMDTWAPDGHQPISPPPSEPKTPLGCGAFHGAVVGN
ncbi:MAG: site-specific integrase [Candidatus Uhrbacteria bacterium]